MYPDQPNPRPPEYPVNYLDQIAPQAVKRGRGPNLKLIVLLLGGALLLVVGLMVLGALTSKPDTSQTLAARLSETATIAKDSHDNIKSSSLRSINSSLTLTLANTNRDLAAHLTAAGIDPATLDPAAAAPEQAEAAELKEKLEDARLNATFDRTYAREMAYRLETILAYIQAAHESTSSSSYREFLAASFENLAPIQQQIAQFNENGS